MLSIFAFPKPFRGHIGVIQRNAISSWTRLDPRCEVFLFGDEEGTADVAAELGVKHVADTLRNEFDTPLLSDVLARGERLARHDIHGYVNCDIILGRDFMTAVQRVSAWRHRFLMIGECWNLDVTDTIDFDRPRWEEELQAAVHERGKARGPRAIDYFIYRRGLYGTLPPFALGRGWFDNWLVWQARNVGGAVVDASKTVHAVHQNHDYTHVSGGKLYTLFGAEATRNLQLAGGPKHCARICEASHVLLPHRLKRSLRGFFSWQTKQRAATAFWYVAELTRPLRHSLGLRMSTVQRVRTLLRGGRTQ